MNCPTNLPKASTQPFRVQAVTLSTVTGRVNVHLEDGLPIVYVATSTNRAVQDRILSIASLAYAQGLTVSVTYEGGNAVPTGDYCKRDMLRITLESLDRGLIPWSDREDPEAQA